MVDAQVVGVDPETDLAVLKIQEKGLPVLALGDSDELRPGQVVLAFGSPLGLENSVTMGVVSSVARQLEPDDPMVYIQTDASINPGNSGGPLVDTSGRVVGINTLIFSQSGGSEGIGFAAPSNIVQRVFQQIRQYGRVRRGVIGVHSQTITPTLAKGLALSRDWGVIVGDVVTGSPAERVGLEVGDIVLTLDGKVMENARQFNVNLYRRAPGDVVTVEVLRGSEKMALPVQVIERPDDLNRFAELVNPEKNLIRELGILGVELDAKIVPMLPGLRKRTGVLVAAGAAGGRTDQGKLLPGDVIYAINRVLITSLEQLRSEVAKLKAGDPLVIQIQRLGQLMFIALELE
jgi:serine protease Do